MQVAHVKAAVDERHLQSALPLGQSGRVKVPMLLYATQVRCIAGKGLAQAHRGRISSRIRIWPPQLHVLTPVLMMQVASYTGDEDANLNIHLEYAATIDASNDTIGRKSTLPVHLHFLPSLEVRPLPFYIPCMTTSADCSEA